jgi:starch synthase
MLIKSKPSKESLETVIISNYLDLFLGEKNFFRSPYYFVCGLSHALKRVGHNVTVILPWYRKIEESLKKLGISYTGKTERVLVPLDKGGSEDKEVEARFFDCGGIRTIFIYEPTLSDRDGFVLDPSTKFFFPDNLKRFVIFSKASLEALKVIPLRPDVIHVLGDWSSVAVVYAKILFKYDNLINKARLVFTIPSLEDQILLPPEQYSYLSLEWKYFSYEFLEFYGKVNIVKGGIVASDITTFLSESYVEEVTKADFGNGLEGVIIQKLNEGKIKGILPGIDTEVWNPKSDKELSKIGANYDITNLQNKAKAKKYLASKYGLQQDSIIFFFYGDLTEKSGISLVYEVFGEILKNYQSSLIVVGRGDDFRELSMSELQDNFKKKVVWLKDCTLGDLKYIISGSDVVLMPSMSEQDSILHMVSMVYGTLPLVRGVGILNDVVRDKINGFKFYNYSPSEFLAKVKEVCDIYFKDPKRWNKLQKAAMKSDFSWDNVAKIYVESVYKETKEGKK